MNILRVVATSRQVSRYAAILVGFCIAALVASRWGGLYINFRPNLRPPVRLFYPEIIAVFAGATGAVLLRPRFWEWDRVATRRASIVAGSCALAGSLLPLAVIAADDMARFGSIPMDWRVCNVIVIGAAIFSLSPFIGPAVAGAVVILFYFVDAVVNNLAYDWAFVPVTHHPDPEVHWWAAGMLLLFATTVHYRTRGSTAWAQRTLNRDE